MGRNGRPKFANEILRRRPRRRRARPRRRASVTNPRRAICIARGTHNTSQWLRGCVSTRRHFRRRSDELHEHGRSGSARRQQRLRGGEQQQFVRVARVCAIDAACGRGRVHCQHRVRHLSHRCCSAPCSSYPAYGHRLRELWPTTATADRSDLKRPLPFATAMMIGSLACYALRSALSLIHPLYEWVDSCVPL